MIEEIIEKYNLEPNCYLRSSFEEFDNLNSYLNNKFKPYIAEGWYGFDLGNAPIQWYQAVNDFLDIIKERCPQMRILQVKQKFGQLRIYLQNVDEEVYDAVSRLETLCSLATSASESHGTLEKVVY